MPSPKQTFRHVFEGGWATDFGNIAEAGISQDGLVRVPFLQECLNNTFELDGGTHKIGGTKRMNAAQYASGAAVVGLYDYWRQGSVGTPAQKIICHAGTLIGEASLDGNFTNLFTGLVSGAVPCYDTFDDLLIISSASADVPRSWDGTTAQNLAGSPPNFSIHAMHKNRVWAAGVNANPSRLFYSAHVDPEDWTGAGSGFIDIDPNDGDKITALASHKDNLWIFKGPYKGSIHRIVGSAPTGADSFGRQTFVRGIGAVGQNTLFRFRDDIGFMWSDGSIHSLAATAAYGDFNEASLSRPINGWLRDHITASRLVNAWAASDTVRGIVLFTLSIDTSTTHNAHLMMDYRFDPPRWGLWNAFASASVATIVDGAVPRLFDGATDGYVRRLLRSDRNTNSATADSAKPIYCKTLTPFLHYSTPHVMKTLERASLGMVPKGDYNADFGWKRDNHSEQSQSVNQGSTGTALGSFVLGTSRLAGSSSADRFMSLEEGGEFRMVQYRVSNGGLNEDLELHNISTTLIRGAESGEN